MTVYSCLPCDSADNPFLKRDKSKKAWCSTAALPEVLIPVEQLAARDASGVHFQPTPIVRPMHPIAIEVEVLRGDDDDGGGGGGKGRGRDGEPQNDAKKLTSGGNEAVAKKMEKKTKKKKPLQPAPPAVTATKKQARGARLNVSGTQQCSTASTAIEREAPAGEQPCEVASVNSFERSVQLRTALWVSETAAPPSSAAAAAATDPVLSSWDISAETMSRRSKQTRTLYDLGADQTLSRLPIARLCREEPVGGAGPPPSCSGDSDDRPLAAPYGRRRTATASFAARASRREPNASQDFSDVDVEADIGDAGCVVAIGPYEMLCGCAIDNNPDFDSGAGHGEGFPPRRGRPRWDSFDSDDSWCD